MRFQGSWLLLVTLVASACSTEGTPSPDAPSTSPPAVTPSTSTPAITPSSLAWSRVDDEAVLGSGKDNQVMTSVTAGGPGLVAVGGDGSVRGAAVWTSLDGLTWTRVPHDEAAFVFQVIFSLTTGGPGLVAVGGDRSSDDVNATVLTSPDGISWTRVDDEAALGGEGDQVMRSVTAGGPGLVAVGTDETVDVLLGIEAGENSDAAVWTSTDGINWTRVDDEAALGGEGNQQMLSVTAGGPGLVAVGFGESGAAVWTSPDGITWTRVDDEAVLGGEDKVMLSVTAGGPGLVAVGFGESGANAAVWTSPDGITWTRVPHDEAAFGGDGSGVMTSVTAGGPGLVAVGVDHSGANSDAAAWTSPDGVTWTRVPHDDVVFGGEGDQGLDSVTAGGPGLVAVGVDQSGAAGYAYAAVWVATREE